MRWSGWETHCVIQGTIYDSAELSAGMYPACKRGATVFENFGVWTPAAPTVTGQGDPEQLPAVMLAQSALPTLGVSPYIGRWFSNEDDTAGAPGTVILSYAYWQWHFGADPNVLGRAMVINFSPYRVIGVMPRDFRSLDRAPDVFLPQRFPATGLRPDEFRRCAGFEPDKSGRPTPTIVNGRPSMV